MEALKLLQQLSKIKCVFKEKRVDNAFAMKLSKLEKGK